MPTPSIRLTDDLYHAAKHSDTSISQMARQGIERGIIESLVGVCWFCGSGIMAKERQDTGDYARLDQSVQVCSRCLDDFEAIDSGEIHVSELEEPYLERAYESGNIYEITPSRLPEIGVAYGIESTAVWDADYYRHAAGDDDGSYWAAKSRHEAILQEDRIPLVEIALRSHAFSLSVGRPMLSVFAERLGRATKRAGDWRNSPYNSGPPGTAFSYDDLLEEGINESKFAVFLDPESYCPACGVASGKGTDECEICFHRWEKCPDHHSNPLKSQCSGDILYEIEADRRDDDDWLSRRCSDCGKYREVVTDEYVKEEFTRRYRRVFEEIEDEHPAIDPRLIPE